MGVNSQYFLTRAIQMYESVALTELRYTVREGLVLEKKLIGKRAVAGTSRSGRTIWRRGSKPGEPPRRRTGALWDSIDTWIDTRRLIARIGSDYRVPHGRRGLLLWMEQGTAKMQPRPSLKRMLKQITAERVKRLRQLARMIPET